MQNSVPSRLIRVWRSRLSTSNTLWKEVWTTSAFANCRRWLRGGQGSPRASNEAPVVIFPRLWSLPQPRSPYRRRENFAFQKQPLSTHIGSAISASQFYLYRLRSRGQRLLERVVRSCFLGMLRGLTQIPKVFDLTTQMHPEPALVGKNTFSASLSDASSVGPRLIAKVGRVGRGLSKKCVGKFEVIPPSEIQFRSIG